MGDLASIHIWLVERFGALLAEHDIPGATVAVLSGDEVVEAAAGVLNRNTGVDVTNDSVFQIGSITKTWTGTLIMQLVDAGKLELDAPVRTYLPDFRVADKAASKAVTARHLLSHTGGFEGDLFVETTRGDDAVERFVADVLPEAPQLFAPGEQYSYCNSGYVVLGRILELLHGKPFREVVHDELATPLGLTQVAANADEAILHRAAVGHLSADARAEPVPAAVWSLHHSNGPAGAMLATTARDLLGFARMHLRDGLAPDGTRLLTKESTRAMREPQVDEPPVSNVGSRRGLAWTIPEWSGGTVIGHNGETIGQRAFLRILPDHDVAVALLTNGGRAYGLYREVVGKLVAELTDVRMPADPEPPAEPQPIDPERYVGTYNSTMRRMEIEPDGDGGLVCTTTLLGAWADMTQQVEPERTTYVRLEGDTFVAAEDDGDGRATFAFVGSDDQGRAAFLHNNRANPRVS